MAPQIRKMLSKRYSKRLQGIQTSQYLIWCQLCVQSLVPSTMGNIHGNFRMDESALPKNMTLSLT